MSETLSDEHHDWVTSALDVDPRSYDAPAAEPAAPAPEPVAAPEPEPEETSGGIFGSISSFVSDVGDAVAGAAETVKDAVVGAATVVADTATEVVHQAEQAVVETVTAVGTAVADVAQSAYKAVKQVIFPPTIPQGRADEKLDKLPPEDKQKVQALLDGAKSEKEKGYITKALAAGHTPAELEEFAKTIAGKDEAWMNDNLRVVGDSKGKGIKQQWSFSCAPTTVEAIKAEMDPLYAMKLRADNPDFQDADNADGTAKNPDMAEDQRSMLEDDPDNQGYATSRDDPDGLGQGMVFKTLLNKQSGTTGLEYDNKKIGKDYTADDAMDAMSKGLADGVPVPITVGDAKHPYAHAALVTATDPGPPRTFTIHDPWEGKTETFTEDQIRNDKVNVGNWKHVGVVFPPSIKR